MRRSSASKSKRAVAGDDDLAVEDAPLGQCGPERVGQLREVAVERLQVARLGVDLVAVAEDERPEAVPLGLEQPAVVRRQVVGGLGQHRFERRFERECHRPTIAPPADRPSPPSGHGRVASDARARSRPRFQAAGLAKPDRSRARPCVPGGSPGRPPFAFRECGERRDQGRHGIVGQHAEIVGVEAGVAVRRDEAGSMTRSTLRAATNPAGATRLSATSATTPMTASPCPSQLHPAGQRRGRS